MSREHNDDEYQYSDILIPPVFMKTKGFSDGTKVVFPVIFTAAYRDVGHICRLSNPGLAKACGMSLKRVEKCLKELEDKGLIARIMLDDGQHQHIKILWTGDGDISRA